MRRSLVSLIMAVLAVTMIGACSVKESSDANGVTTDATSDAGSTGGPLFGDVDESDDLDVDTDSSGTDSTGSGSASGSGGSGTSQPTTSSSDPLEIKTDDLKVALQSQSYLQKLTGRGGSGQYEWIATSGLPANGLELSGRRIKGTPEKAGEFPITIKLKDEESGSTVSKDFKLTVIKNMKEDLRVKVERLDKDGVWNVVADLKDEVKIERSAKRLRLSVERDDGKLPSAPRYHWKVKSPDQRLAVFVPPHMATNSTFIKLPEAQKVYLMAWDEKGTARDASLDLALDEIDLSGTRVFVQDDYGNKADVEFKSLAVEETLSQKCKTSGGVSVTIPDPTGPINVKDVLAYHNQTFIARAEGGTPPYRWEYSEPVGGPADAPRQWLMHAIERELEDNAGNAHFGLLFQVWPVVDDPYENPKRDIIVTATDACGKSASARLGLEVYYPQEQLSNLRISISLDGDLNDVDGNNTWLRLDFLNDGTSKAAWRVEFHTEDLEENMLAHSGWVAGDPTAVNLNTINGVFLSTWDSCRSFGCVSLDCDADDAWLLGKYWVAVWHDHGDQVTRENDNEDNITGNFVGFKEHGTLWRRRGDIFPEEGFAEFVTSRPMDPNCPLTQEEIDEGWGCL